MAYITTTDVINGLNLQNLSATATSALAAIIAGVEQAAEAHCNRTWSATTQQIETFDGGQTVYFPTKGPISTITSITVDGTALSTDEIYNYGTHIRLEYATTRGYRNVVITYTPAESLPNDVKLALIQWAGQLFKAAEDGGKTLERARIGEVEMWYAAKDGMPQSVKEVLDRHRVIPI